MNDRRRYLLSAHSNPSIPVTTMFTSTAWSTARPSSFQHEVEELRPRTATSVLSPWHLFRDYIASFSDDYTLSLRVIALHNRLAVLSTETALSTAVSFTAFTAETPDSSVCALKPFALLGVPNEEPHQAARNYGAASMYLCVTACASEHADACEVLSELAPVRSSRGAIKPVATILLNEWQRAAKQLDLTSFAPGIERRAQTAPLLASQGGFQLTRVDDVNALLAEVRHIHAIDPMFDAHVRAVPFPYAPDTLTASGRGVRRVRRLW